MTLPLERARSRRPVTWLTLIGVLLLPVVIGGILITALYNPIERLDGMSAAIVNDDEPVTLDGQYVPLGRQLTAGLVEGSDEIASNLTWTISNTKDAASGLADGTYDAVITIPSNFSAAATSTAPGGTPEQATIEVATAPDSLIVDDAITAQVTQAAASLMGTQLSSVYLENVFLGFTTLGDQLGTAADGAHQLADGAGAAADGATSLADGVRQLADGTGALVDGAGQLASGAAPLASGAAQLAAGTNATASGLQQWAAGAHDNAEWTSTLAAGLQKMAEETAQIPAVPQEVVDGINDIAANSEQIKDSAAETAAQLAGLAATCEAEGGSAQLCAALAQASTRADAALPTINNVLDQSGAIATKVGDLAQLGPELTAGLQQSAGLASKLAGGMTKLADGATTTAAGAQALASGMSGIADGAGRFSSGATQLSSGLGQWATGARSAASGADTLAGGVGDLADGTTTLADGLTQAADAVPSYTDSEATDLASVVANPVGTEGVGTSLFGASAIPLLAMLALWFGALASFVALQAVPRHALSSRRSSVLLALRALAPAAAIGAAQGLLVAGVVQLAAGYDAASWWGFAGLAVTAGVVFAAVNQALVAVFGGAGRWISALVGVLAIATGIVSTVPGALTAVTGLLPTTPAYTALLATLTPASGIGAGLVGMIVWAALAFVATVVAVTRRRTANARSLLAASPALA